MSQFMMCKAEFDLSKYGGKLLSLCDMNNMLFSSVLKRYFAVKEYSNIWIIEDIHDYCDKVIDNKSFNNSKLFYMLDNIYDLCDWILLWYGSEYDDLDEVYSKDEFITYIQQCVKNPCCELYVKVCK